MSVISETDTCLNLNLQDNEPINVFPKTKKNQKDKIDK